MNINKGLIAGSALLLSACATVNGPTDEQDPWEGFNRSMYQFNDALDRNIARPVAEAYEKVVPEPVNTGITNFFSNLGDITVLVNDMLQLKLDKAVSDLGRLTWNSTVGLLGFIDVATPMGFPKRDEDFGQTLGYWGMPSGPYVVLPLFGPSTLRDSAALPADWATDPLIIVERNEVLWGAVTLRLVDTRAGLLRVSNVVEQAALDPYAFTRDAWLQRRRSQIYDGAPPMEEFDIFDDEELFDEGSDESLPPAQ